MQKPGLFWNKESLVERIVIDVNCIIPTNIIVTSTEIKTLKHNRKEVFVIHFQGQAVSQVSKYIYHL